MVCWKLLLWWLNTLDVILFGGVFVRNLLLVPGTDTTYPPQICPRASRKICTLVELWFLNPGFCVLLQVLGCDKWCKMRGRSYGYSPSPPRSYGRTGRSPSPRGRYGYRGGDPPTSLLVRNLHRDCRFGFVTLFRSSLCWQINSLYLPVSGWYMFSLCAKMAPILDW